MAEIYVSPALDNPDVDQALQVDPTVGYYAQPYGFSEYLIKNIPLFTLWSARQMLTDPIVKHSLDVRNAAVSVGEIIVTGKDKRVADFVRQQWDRIWKHNQRSLLRAKQWGYGAYQVLYEKNESTGLLSVVGIKDFSPQDVRAIRVGGKPAGFRIQNRHVIKKPDQSATYYMKFPQALWVSFDSEFGSMYGRSILRGAYMPWFEKWMNHGAKKSQQMRMVKDAYPQLAAWYPGGERIRLPDGSVATSQNVARSLLANMMTGGTLTMPSETGDDGKRKWDVSRIPDGGDPSRMFRWVEELNDDIFIAIAGPKEIVMASSSGSGYSGRSIPLAIFLQSCQMEFCDLVKAIRNQVLDPLCKLNFGNADYEIEVESLLDTFTKLMSDEMGGRGIGGADSRSGKAKSFTSNPNSNPEAKLAQPGQIEKRGDASVIGDRSTGTVSTQEKQRKVKQFADDPPRTSMEELAMRLTKDTLNRMAVEIESVAGSYPIYDARMLDEIKSVIVKYSDEVGAQIGALSFSSYIDGSVAAATLVDAFLAKSGRMMPMPGANITVAQAADVFENGLEVSGRVLRDLSASPVVAGANYMETAEAVKDGAFALTGKYSDETLYEVRNILKHVVKQGGDASDFSSMIREAISDGDFPMSEPYLDMVYRTQLHAQYSNGMEDSLSNPDIAYAFPYRRYRATKDERVRDEHMALESNGLENVGGDKSDVYWADSDVWTAFRAPWDFGCRCAFAPQTVAEAARRGVSHAKAWMERAKNIAAERGGKPEYYLRETTQTPTILWPRHNGELIEVNPAFDRTL